MPWFQRAVVSDEKLLIWRAVVIMKAEVFSFPTSHHSTKSDKNFPLFWGRFQRGTQNGRDIPPLAGKLLNSLSEQILVNGVHLKMLAILCSRYICQLWRNIVLAMWQAVKMYMFGTTMYILIMRPADNHRQKVHSYLLRNLMIWVSMESRVRPCLCGWCVVAAMRAKTIRISYGKEARYHRKGWLLYRQSPLNSTIGRRER